MRIDICMRSLTRFLLLAAVLVLIPSACVRANNIEPEPLVSPPGLAPCGMADASIPDFTLVDDNASSPTAGQEVSLSNYSGKVLLIFWMRAT